MGIPNSKVEEDLARLSALLSSRGWWTFSNRWMWTSPALSTRKKLRLIGSFASHQRKEKFAKLNTDQLFAAVDKDGNGKIELSEWIEFWTNVKKAGHSEEEISEEVRFRLTRSNAWRHGKAGASSKG